MQQQGLKPATKIVLYWIADHHNESTGDCFPSITRLAELAEMSRRAVEGHIATLEQLNLVHRISRMRPNGSKTSNVYQLNLIKQDAQNLRMPPAESAHAHTQNLRIHNLGNNNLGNITSNNTSMIGQPLQDLLAKKLPFPEQLFEDLWKIYPKKVGKGNAKKALVKALTKATEEKIQHSLTLFVQSWGSKDKKFMPHLSTWLNGERWDDELQEQSLQDMTSEQQMQAILGSSEPSISQSLLAKYDRSKPPNPERLQKIANRLGMSIEQLNSFTDRKRMQ